MYALYFCIVHCLVGTMCCFVVPKYFSYGCCFARPTLTTAPSVCECRDCTKAKQKDCPGKKGSVAKSYSYHLVIHCLGWHDCCKPKTAISIGLLKYHRYFERVTGKGTRFLYFPPIQIKHDFTILGCKYPSYKKDGNCDDENVCSTVGRCKKYHAFLNM